MAESLSQLSRLKPGGHPLRREVVVHHQRERILKATVELVAERGYRAVTVAAIVKAAGVSRLKFYENFGSKQDAFLAALDLGLEGLLETSERAGEGVDDDPPARVSAVVAALLEDLAARPDFARAAIVEAPALGAELGDRPARALAAFAPLLESARGGKRGAKLPAATEETVLGGIYWLLYDALLAESPPRLTELRSTLVEFALVPYLGPVAAAGAANG